MNRNAWNSMSGCDRRGWAKNLSPFSLKGTKAHAFLFQNQTIFPQERILSTSSFSHIITNISPNRELRAAAPNTLRFTQNIVTLPTPFHTEQMPNISWTERAEFMHRDHRRGRLNGLFLKYNSFNSQARCCCLVSGNYTAQAKGKHIFSFVKGKADQSQESNNTMTNESTPRKKWTTLPSL